MTIIIVTLTRYEDVDRFALIGRCLLTSVSPRMPPGGIRDMQDAAGPLILQNNPVYHRVLR